MRTFQRLLTLLFACMLFLPTAAFAEAEAEPPKPSADVVYISSAGKDRNDGKTEETAVKSLEAATASLPNGGTVTILDNTEIDLRDTEVLKDAHRIYLSPSTATVYIRGKKAADGTVPTLTLRADDNKAPCLELGGPLAIEDLNIRVSGQSNLWISANGNTFTAGANLSFSLQEGNFSAKLTGGKQDAGSSGVMEADAAPTLNIFGGEWGNIYGGSFAKATAAQVGGEVTVNFYGGKVKEITTHRSSATQNANAVINLWCGNAESITGGKFGEGFAPTLNIYNGVLPTDFTGIKDPFRYGEDGNVHTLTGTAPTFDEVSFVTIQAPDSDDKPDPNPDTPSGGSGTTAAPDPTPTKPSPATPATPAGSEANTTDAAKSETSDGCTSGIGFGAVGLLMLAAVIPFLTKKQNQKGENQ